MKSFSEFLTEGVAQRKIVVRAGKRKIIFRCKPGEKKFGKLCRKRNSRDLLKMKRSARKAARKSRSKRNSAKRKRNMSLRRRKTLVHQTRQSSAPKIVTAKKKH
jgi:hypothetical protein